MKNPKTLLTVAGVIALLLVGFLYVRGPKPIIEIKAESLTGIGPFPLANTYVSSLSAVVVILVLGYIAGRKASLIPRGVQNLVELVFEAGYNLCVGTAGERHGRRFFPVFMTIFIFIWVANWMALLPFFNAIGSVQKVSVDEFRKEAAVMSNSGGILLVKPKAQEVKFEVDLGPCTFKNTPAAENVGTAAADAAARKNSCVRGQRALAIVDQLEKKRLASVADPATCPGAPGDKSYTDCLVGLSDEALNQLSAKGKSVGIIAPYFRSMNTDINSPLSIAIMSAIFVEFWGITTLGFFKYAKKFFTISSPINFFVGLLEFIAEVARLISFTFRLFGNMLAGEILLLVMTFLAPFVVALPFYALEMFVGVIQAFVFAMLTLVFAVLAVSTHDGHDEHEPVEVTAIH
ncbi:MAG: F0F1 ATP synthase subunit A [Dehalococcoidia bacterium]|nr:F0F1 ATP synthase subunit A [Dehalococcoidia bacterium]